jgi:hypothetical protein
VLVAARAVSPANRRFAGFEELRRPPVIQPLGDALPPAKLGNARPAPQAVPDNAIFSSAEYCLRVARRVLFTSRSDRELTFLDFSLSSRSPQDDDEPEILSSSTY